MSSASLGVVILVLLPVFNKVWGDGCTGILPFDTPVINMCEQRSVTLGRVHLSVTTDAMGNYTRCSCTLSSKTPGLNTSTFFYLKATNSCGSKCSQSLIHITPFERVIANYVETFTCTTPLDATSYTGITSSNVTISLTRPDTSVAVSYCVFLHPDRWQDGDMELSCESGTISNQTITTSITSILPTATCVSSPPSSMAASSSSVTTSSVTSSVLTTTTSAPPTPTATSDTEGTGIGTSFTVTTGPPSTAPGGPDFPVATVAGAVSAAVVLIAVVVIVVVIVCKRRQGRQKPPPPVRDNAHENPEYSAEGPVSSATNGPYSKTSSVMETPSSSQTRLLQGMLAPSSSPYELDEDVPPDNGAVSINPAAGSAEMKLDTNGSQPPNPAASLYAVVNKPKGRQLQTLLPEKSPKPGALSTSARGGDVRAGPTGDEYAVVDKTRKKGGNAKEKSGLPSSEAMPPPVPPSPGLQYADLEEVRGEGRRPAPPRPAANMATGTEYGQVIRDVIELV